MRDFMRAVSACMHRLEICECYQKTTAPTTDKYLPSHSPLILTLVNYFAIMIALENMHILARGL